MRFMLKQNKLKSLHYITLHSSPSTLLKTAIMYVSCSAGLLHGVYTASILIGFHLPLKTD
jgi:hypothetical protein